MKGGFERDFVQKVVLYAQAQEKRDLQLLRLREKRELELRVQVLEEELGLVNNTKWWFDLLLLPLKTVAVLCETILCLLTFPLFLVLAGVFFFMVCIVVPTSVVFDAEFAQELCYSAWRESKVFVVAYVLPALDYIAVDRLNHGTCDMHTPEAFYFIYGYVVDLFSFYLEWRCSNFGICLLM